MRRWGVPQALLTLAASVGVWAILATLCLLVGSTGSIGFPARATFSYRLESVLAASLVGAALSLSGVVYQAILRNPLADPYLLGVSSGASLFAYLWQFAGITAFLALSQQAFAFAGALLAIALVFLLASQRGRLEPITLLLVGVIVNAVNASIFLLINAMTRDRPAAGGPVAFLVGSIQTVTVSPAQRLAASAIVAVGGLCLWSMAGALNAAVLEEAEAQALGVRIHRLRWIALVLASLVTAAAVAVSGPIGFVGLVCPHVARLLMGADVRRLLPVSAGVGAGVLALADAASRYLAAQGRAQVLLPVGVLTGLMGGPFFLYLLWRGRRAHAA